MASAPVRILPTSELAGLKVLTTPRIGISKAIDWPLRFVGEWHTR